MPPKFDRCHKGGGRVRTLKGGRKICFPRGGGRAQVGHKPQRQSQGRR